LKIINCIIHFSKKTKSNSRYVCLLISAICDDEDATILVEVVENCMYVLRVISTCMLVLLAHVTNFHCVFPLVKRDIVNN